MSTRRTLLPGLPNWTVLGPALGIAAVLFSLGKAGPVGVFLAALVLVASVLAAVHHAEIVAKRVGEPFGALVLAVSVTVIEVSLIVSLMFSGAGDAQTLARDTVFAAVMIILNGIIGACLLGGGIRHGVQRFSLSGASAALCVLAAVVVLTLALPNYTLTTPGPTYSTSQLVFVAVVSLLLYLTFVLVQTVRHREQFLPAEGEEIDGISDGEAPPRQRTALTAFVMLLVALTAVVLLAKGLSPALERGVREARLPIGVVGVVIAGLVLAPESLAAFRAARRDQLQISLNLALGSALASICLTIPAVAVTSLILDLPIALGIDSKSMTLLALSLFVAALTLGTGRTTLLQGAVHLVIFAVYLFVTVVP